MSGDHGIQLPAVSTLLLQLDFFVQKPVVAIVNLLSACCVWERLKWCCLKFLPEQRGMQVSQKDLILPVLKTTCFRPLTLFPLFLMMRCALEVADGWEANRSTEHARKSCCIIANELLPSLRFASACHYPSYTSFPITPCLGCFVTCLLNPGALPQLISLIESHHNLLHQHSTVPEICIFNYRNSLISAAVYLVLILLLRVMFPLLASFPWLCSKVFLCPVELEQMLPSWDIIKTQMD